MTRRLRFWMRWLVLLASSGWLFQAGCARILTREFEVLFAPQANLTQINNSFLVDVFGPGILRLFN